MRKTLVIGLLLSLSLGLGAQPLGKTLDDFPLHTLDGKKTRLLALRGDKEALLFMFWCTKCTSCRLVEQDLDKLSQQLKGKARVVAISSSKTDNAAKIVAFQKKRRSRFTVLLDPASQMAHRLGIRRTTTAVILDKENRVRYWGSYASGNAGHARAAISALLAGRRIIRPTTPIDG